MRCRVEVFNSIGETLWVAGRIHRDHPHRPHWIFGWGCKVQQEQPVNLRRLDLRDSHSNPDGESWHQATHKHVWSAASGNAWAYTPSDIPHDADPEPVGADDYRLVFEAFAHESGIVFGPDYKWAVPDLAPDPATPLWEVP